MSWEYVVVVPWGLDKIFLLADIKMRGIQLHSRELAYWLDFK